MFVKHPSLYSVNVAYHKFQYKHPLNKSEMCIENKKFQLKSCKHIFLNEICNIFGRIDLYLIIKREIMI